MVRPTILILLAAVLLVGPPASAASVSVEITGTDGHPVAGAVVELTSLTSSAGSAAKIATEAVVDQRNETFVPLVTLIRRGGHVTFTNNDTTMHQVYSFSEIRQFAFEIDRGERSEPVVFDKAGVAAIGCNIHDQMITYVYVAAAPWAGLTDADGKLTLGDVPQGAYRANVWHPRLVPGQPPAAIPLTVSGDSAKLTASIPLLAGDPRGKKRMHMQMY
jgi:plastocyanin